MTTVKARINPSLKKDIIEEIEDKIERLEEIKEKLQTCDESKETAVTSSGDEGRPEREITTKTSPP